MSWASETAGEELDTGDHEPGESTFDGGLEILGETAVSVEPGDGALDHPAALDEVEARGGLDALDDFDRPLAELFECGLEFVAGVAGIGEDMAQPGKGIADGGEEERGSITILEACFMHDRADQQARCVGQDVALAALDLLAGVIPCGPPASVVLTDWLSMTPAEGLASRPTASRASISRTWLICRHRPLSRQG